MDRNRLLALDLDGTLLRDDGTIDARDQAAIERLRASGCAVTLATGRMTAATLDVARALELDTPLICADGRILADARTGASIELHCVPRRVDALAIMREHSLALLHITPRAVVHEPTAGTHLGHVSSLWEQVSIAPVLDAVDGDEAVLVLGLGAFASAVGAESAIAARLGEAVAVDSYPLASGPHVVRVRAPGHDKHTALARLAERLGVAVDDVAAVGDWYNDIGMLRWAGRSFALRGAPEAVCSAADEVLDAKGGAGGGVAEAIDRWLDGRAR